MLNESFYFDSNQQRMYACVHVLFVHFMLTNHAWMFSPYIPYVNNFFNCFFFFFLLQRVKVFIHSFNIEILNNLKENKYTFVWLHNFILDEYEEVEEEIYFRF